MLKNKLKNKELTIGSWISLGHPAIAEIFANAGFDWLVVDMEHSTISIDQAGELIRTIDLAGSVPLVRLTSNDPNQIKRLMDAGALGIIVPNVKSKEEAVDAVAATRYAPKGTRGVGLARGQRYGAGFKEYLKWQNDGPIVIAQIEHEDAVKNLEEILSAPGIDGFIIGPYDLSCSMGIPGEFEHPDFKNTMDFIRLTSQKIGCPGGLHVVEPDREALQKVIDSGYTFIAYSVDIRMLDVGARSGLDIIKEK